jgi:uncharacterized protein GlcG (DUF336 family)
MNAAVRQIPSITSATARAAVEAAVAAAEAAGQNSAIAVVDATGQLIAFTRMDGAPVQAAQIAQDKAYTAAGFGMPSGQWHDVMAADAPLGAGAATAVDRLVPFGGGLPIQVEGRTIGGIGVSGGHWSDDDKIAQAGAAVVG